jgi:hypothetical protein
MKVEVISHQHYKEIVCIYKINKKFNTLKKVKMKKIDHPNYT